MASRIRTPSPPRLILRFLEELTRVSYGRLLSVWGGIIVCFATVYFALSFLSQDHTLSNLSSDSPLLRLLDCLYFSVITSTTVGYGDLTPQGLSKFFAATESIFGYFVFAVFIAKLLSYKSERMMQAIHELMYENTFHQTREGFFTVRKDYDLLIAEAENTGTLSADSWDKFIIAFWESRRLLMSIRQLHGEEGTSPLDDTREKLLLEAIHRTLTRLHQLLDLLRKTTGKERVMMKTELQALVRIIATTLASWKRDGHAANAEWFARAEKIGNALKKQAGTTR